MTRCPICRGVPIDCICDDGLVEHGVVAGGVPTRRESAVFWLIVSAALIPWILVALVCLRT